MIYIYFIISIFWTFCFFLQTLRYLWMLSSLFNYIRKLYLFHLPWYALVSFIDCTLIMDQENLSFSNFGHYRPCILQLQYLNFPVLLQAEVVVAYVVVVAGTLVVELLCLILRWGLWLPILHGLRIYNIFTIKI